MHKPVLFEETLKILINGGGVYVDCTLGGGGHARGILKSMEDIFLIGIDADESALQIAEENLRDFEGRYALYKANFKDIDEVLKMEGISKVKGILFDLGISMYQLRSGRGFSFEDESFLDMRIDKEQRLTAFTIINEYSEKKIAEILKKYGEERYAQKIAREIVKRRKRKPIETAKELADLISSVYPKGGKIHPATKTFMALRIYVNSELENLEIGLDKGVMYLQRSGRIVVITFHSLEDRIVKHFLREKEKEGIIKNLTKKPIKPKLEEVRENPSARSAKLRAGEKLV